MVKKIGISLRITEASNYDEKRDTLSHDWPLLLEKLDMAPIFIPNAMSNLVSFLDELNLDGIILSGGENLGTHQERDNTELELISYGIKNHIPILGVCRGMQLINKFSGGSIIETTNKKHVGITHEINLSNPFIKNIFTENFVSVNSFHNNIITKETIGENLESFAVSKNDETIEGIIHKEFLLMGVMWHPERKSDPFNQQLIKNIFEKNTWKKK